MKPLNKKPRFVPKGINYKCLLLLISVFFRPSLGQAHEIRPAYLEITENKNHTINILWKQPAVGEMAIKLVPHLSSGWLNTAPTSVQANPGYFIKRWQNIKAGSVNLDKQEIQIEGLESTITDVLVSITWADGTSMQKILRPDEVRFMINKQRTEKLPVWSYIRLGVEHILAGFDHLLFVLALLLLVKNRSLLVKTVSAFTLAHSITLTCATMGWVKLQPSVVEAIIALSIVFLAVELVHNYRGRAGIVAKYPWLAAFSFGLLHGFGFAGALQDIGLPVNNIPLALLLFNAGVEIGQLLFIAAVLSLLRAARFVIAKIPAWTKLVPPYAIGALSASWFIERLLTIF